MAVTFTQFSENCIRNQPDLSDLLESNQSYNYGRLGNSAVIGAAGSYLDSTFATVGAGFINGSAKSDSAWWNIPGHIVDGIKGGMESFAIKKVVDMFPEKYRPIAGAVIGIAAKLLDSHMEKVEKEQQAEAVQRVMNSPTLEGLNPMDNNKIFDSVNNTAIGREVEEMQNDQRQNNVFKIR